MTRLIVSEPFWFKFVKPILIAVSGLVYNAMAIILRNLSKDNIVSITPDSPPHKTEKVKITFIFSDIINAVEKVVICNIFPMVMKGTETNGT